MMKYIMVESVDELNELVPMEDTIVQVRNESCAYRMSLEGEWEKIQIYNE